MRREICLTCLAIAEIPSLFRAEAPLRQKPCFASSASKNPRPLPRRQTSSLLPVAGGRPRTKTRCPSQIYLTLVSVTGGTPRQLTREGTDNERPRWSPIPAEICLRLHPWRILTGNRGRWTPTSTHPRRSRASRPKPAAYWSRPTAKLVFQSPASIPDAGGKKKKKKKTEADAKAPSKARTYTSLLYRHWTEWRSRRRQHLLVSNVDGTMTSATSRPANTTSPRSR